MRASRVEQVAERVGLSPSTIYKLNSTGDLPSPKTVGNIKFWRARDVDDSKRNRVDGRRFNGRRPKRHR